MNTKEQAKIAASVRDQMLDVNLGLMTVEEWVRVYDEAEAQGVEHPAPQPHPSGRAAWDQERKGGGAVMFQINRSRFYTEDGERHSFNQTILAELCSPSEYRVVDVVAEENRPSFDPSSRPTGGTFIPIAAERYFATGEWQRLP